MVLATRKTDGGEGTSKKHPHPCTNVSTGIFHCSTQWGQQYRSDATLTIVGFGMHDNQGFVNHLRRVWWIQMPGTVYEEIPTEGLTYQTDGF